VLVRRLVRLAAALCLAGLLVSLDAVTKSWAVSELSRRGARTVIDGHLVLRVQQNSGIAFGLFRAHLHADKGRYLVTYKAAMAGGLGLLLGWRLLRRREDSAGQDWIVPLGLVALLGGTVGNLLDRARTKAVTDFIDVRFAGVRWPAFNLADVFLAVGLALCVAGLVVAVKRRRDESAAAAEAR
jgi:signal peptidase II